MNGYFQTINGLQAAYDYSNNEMGGNELKQRNQMVARGGIEPPTHGFSIRCSTD